MNLPFRIQTEPGTEPVLSVDGAFGAPGLNLSHWPGHSTPEDLRRDLSTEIALAFSALPQERQDELARGCVAVVNNHFDTDGVCAAFAVLQPEAARAHAKDLVRAAAAGDLFRAPSAKAFWLDVVVNAFVDPERSPIAADLAGASSTERYQLASLALFDRLPDMLAPGGMDTYEDLWSQPFANLESDRADLALANFDELVHLDAGVYTAPPDLQASRPCGGCRFDPGRHAVFGTTELDRVLLLAPGQEGCLTRLLINTTSWFDLPSRRPQARPDMAALAASLNGAEGCSPTDEVAWRHQPADSPAPELWFGLADPPLFTEHGTAHCRPSGLDPMFLKAQVLDALRATWSFSEDDDEEEGDWRLP